MTQKDAGDEKEGVRLVLDAQLPNETMRGWIYRLLLANIVQLNLAPGQAITEHELARTLRASRTPIREALKQLANDGFVEITSQRGTRVSLIDAAMVEEDRFLRMCLEQRIAMLAAESVSEEWLVRLRALFDMMRIAFRDNNPLRFIELDEEFHQNLFACCGRERTWGVITKSGAHLTRARVLNIKSGYPGEWEQVLVQHEAILAALDGRDPAAASEAVEQHLSRPGWNVLNLRARFSHYFTA